MYMDMDMEERSAKIPTATFDGNAFYRITNFALGSEFSLDVRNPDTEPPDGSLEMSPSGPFSGQIWQVLESSTSGHYYLSTAWLGAKKKMDALMDDKGNFAPFLRNFTQDYDQTWALTPSVDAASNTTIFTFVPDFIAAGNLVMSVYNDSSNKPFLASIGAGSQNTNHTQQWLVQPEGESIDDPTYSATHLPALATETSVIPDGFSATATATSTSGSTPGSVSASATPGSSNSGQDHLTAPLIAVAVITPTTFVIFLAAFFFFICYRRRKFLRMQRNIPYPSRRTSSHYSATSEILDTVFSQESLSRWKAQNGPESSSTVMKQGSGRHIPFASTFQSIVSSNLSKSTAIGRPEDSTAMFPANPLSAPPRAHSKSMGSSQSLNRPRAQGSPFYGGSALGLADDDPTLTSEQLYHMEIEEMNGKSDRRPMRVHVVAHELPASREPVELPTSPLGLRPVRTASKRNGAQARFSSVPEMEEQVSPQSPRNLAARFPA